MKAISYVINLERAQGRRKIMSKELKAAKVDFTFVDAFDASKHQPETLLEHCKREGPWGFFHNSNMACTISHAICMEKFLQSDADVCLVLEDDVYVSPEMGQWLNDLSWWPTQAELIKLETWIGKTTKVLLAPPIKTYNGRHVQRLQSRHPGTGGYLINRKGAQRLLNERPFNQPIDQLLFNPLSSKLVFAANTFQVNPALLTQGNDPADEKMLGGVRQRPKGAALVRQKLRRGWCELSGIPRSLVYLVFKKSKLTNINYIPVANGDINST